MKEIIAKVLRCTAVLAFCFSAGGMRSVTMTCEEGFHPINYL